MRRVFVLASVYTIGGSGGLLSAFGEDPTHAIDLDQNGDAADRLVWTGTTRSGDDYPGQMCGDWSANSGKGTAGSSKAMDGNSTQNVSANCVTTYSLYCFEE